MYYSGIWDCSFGRNKMSGSVPEAGTESATRVADVLLLFTDRSELGVSEISRDTGFGKTVVHRILQSLASRGLVVYEERSRKYKLGDTASALGTWALGENRLRRIALPVLRRLQRDTGETTTVSELIGTARVYLDQVVSLQEIKMTVELGRPFPMHAGSSSKVILAFSSPELRRLILDDPLPALTSRTVVGREDLERELSLIAERGVAVSFGERQAGAGAVAAPVLGMDGYAIGSVSACGPVDRFETTTVETLSPLVQKAAEDVSKRMVWSGNPHTEVES